MGEKEGRKRKGREGRERKGRNKEGTIVCLEGKRREKEGKQNIFP